MNVHDIVPPHSSQVSPEALHKAVRGEPEALHGVTVPILPELKNRKKSLLVGLSEDKHKFHKDLKHVEPKSCQDLLSQVRRLQNKNLHKTKTLDKHALLSQVRSKQEKLHPSPVLKKSVLVDILGEVEKMFPVVAKETIVYGKKHLHHQSGLVDKHALLSEVRTTHKHLKHRRSKSNPLVLSEIRHLHGDTNQLHHAPTVAKQELLSEVRLEHGGKQHLMMHHAPEHTTTPVELMRTVRNEHGTRASRLLHLRHTRPKSMTDLMRDIRHQHGSFEHLCSPPAAVRQSLLLELRTNAPLQRQLLLKHVSHTKCRIDLFQEIRQLHGNVDKLRWTMTVDKPALLAQVRQSTERRHSLKHAEHKTTPADLMREVRQERGNREKLHWTPSTVNKQAVLSEVRKEHALREIHLQHSPTIERQSLLSAVRATHGLQQKH